MTRIDIFSGFLGAGKTTLIKKLIEQAYQGEKLVLIENEFGEIGIDGGFLQQAGIEITEMNSGCICCSLVGDFGRALRKVIDEFAPDRILIEPSGVGKLSDVIAAVKNVESPEVRLGAFTTVIDATSCAIYMENFGEFYNNQIQTASCLVLSRTDELSDAETDEVVALLRAQNASAPMITTPWDRLTGKQIQQTMEQTQTLAQELAQMQHEVREHHHHEHEHHHPHEHEEHEHHHPHEHEEHEHHHHHEHEEHEHHHPHEYEEHEHHHHDHDGHEHHHHHHDHDADEVFASWGRETPKKFEPQKLEEMLKALNDTDRFGLVLRAKGIVPAQDGSWIHFDYVPGKPDVRSGGAGVTGRICVIGSKLNEREIAALFGV